MYILGLGYCTLTVITIVTIYYMVIISWIIFYFVVSINFTSDLGWGSCNHDFNTERKCDLNSYFFVHIHIYIYFLDTNHHGSCFFLTSDLYMYIYIYSRVCSYISRLDWFNTKTHALISSAFIELYIHIIL